MDIAIISEHASPISTIGGKDAGGQNIYVAQLAKHLAVLGHNVEVFTRKEHEDDPLVIDVDEGYRVVNVIAGPQKQIDKEKILPFMKDFSSFMKDYIRINHKNFDVIHANFWMSGIVALDLKKTLNIPFAITFHALGRVRRLHQGKNDSFPDDRFLYEDYIVGEADAIIAECPQDQDDLINLYGAHSKKIHLVPCGFDSSEMIPLDKEQSKANLGIDPRCAVILHLGRIVPRKGADNVIRGYAAYKRKTNQLSRLLIVGGESDDPCPKLTPEIGRLMEVAKLEGVADDVVFTGRRCRSQLRQYYSAADVFVTTPWYEPFGITPLEAMACGTPVIGSAVGGIKFSVLHGHTGLLVPPNNPQALQEALQRILEDREYREFLSMKAIERANNHFRWEQMVEQIESVLRMLTNHYATNVDVYQLNQEVLNERRETIRW